MLTTTGNSIPKQTGDAADASRRNSRAKWLTRLGGRVVTAIAAAGLLLAGAGLPAASQEAGGFGASGAGGQGTSAAQQPKGTAKPGTKPGAKSVSPPAAVIVPDGGAAPGDRADPQPATTSIPSLDEMLIAALAENPDIRVAEANLHAAEAELNRSRLSVVRKVMEFRQRWEAQKILSRETWNAGPFKAYQKGN